jgi:hypothetical protein
MGIELTRRSNNNNSAIEEFFFFYTQATRAVFDPFAIC